MRTKKEVLKKALEILADAEKVLATIKSVPEYQREFNLNLNQAIQKRWADKQNICSDEWAAITGKYFFKNAECDLDAEDEAMLEAIEKKAQAFDGAFNTERFYL